MLAAQLGFLPRLALRPDRMAWVLGRLLGVAALLAMMSLATSQSPTLGVAALIGAWLGLALGLQSSVANAGQAIGSVSAGALFGALGHGALPALALAVAPLTLILIEMQRRAAAGILSNR